MPTEPNINLMPFCSKSRPEISKPLKHGPHLYATDGAIMVRVDAPDPNAPDDEFTNRTGFKTYIQILNTGPEGTEFAIPVIRGVQARAICYTCAGNLDGVIDDDCEECKGAGVVPFYIAGESHLVGDRLLCDGYINRITQHLPNASLFLPRRGEREPVGILFDGGIGLLMPKKPNT